jgi:hypothetical protein
MISIGILATFGGCLTCDAGLRAGIFGEGFWPMAGMIVSRFMIAGSLVALLHRIK